MPIPRGLLVPGEAVVLDLHPHGRALVRPLAAVPLTVGVAAFLLTVMPAWTVGSQPLQGWLRLAVLAVALGVLVRWSLLPYLRWRGRRYVVTTERVVLREGLARRRGRDVPLGQVVEVGFSRGVVDRLCRSGTLVVETTAEHGALVLTAVPRVGEVRRALDELVRDAARGVGRRVPELR